MSEFIKGKRYRIIDVGFWRKYNINDGDIGIYDGTRDDNRELGYFIVKGNRIEMFYSRFDPTSLPDPIEYTPEVVYCTWCGEPVLFPASHLYICIQAGCTKSVHLCDKCRKEAKKSEQGPWVRCYCSEHVEQHRPKNESICFGCLRYKAECNGLLDAIDCPHLLKDNQPEEEENKLTDCNVQINTSATINIEKITPKQDIDISIDDTANAGIAAVMFGSKPKQTYAEKTWKGPSKKEIDKKKFVEEERKRYDIL